MFTLSHSHIMAAIIVAFYRRQIENEWRKNTNSFEFYIFHSIFKAPSCTVNYDIYFSYLRSLSGVQSNWCQLNQ